MTYGKSDYDDIKKRFQQRQEQKEGSGKFWKPKAPADKTQQLKYDIRLMPPPPNQTNWFFAYGIHYRLDDGSGGTVNEVCPRLTIQERCPACEFVKPLWDGDEGDKKLARKIGAKRRYVSNIIELKEPSVVKTWDYGEKVWEQLCILNVGSAGVIPIDNPEIGHDLAMTVGLKVTEDGKYPQYNVNFGNIKPTPIPDMKVIQKLPDFKKIVLDDIKTYEQLTAILKGEQNATTTADPADPVTPAADIKTSTAPQTETEAPQDGGTDKETEMLVEKAQRAIEARKNA